MHSDVRLYGYKESLVTKSQLMYPLPILTQESLDIVHLLKTRQEYGAANLLIVYYAGHGLMNGSRQAVWTSLCDLALRADN
jgi:hypothetical protein